MFFFCKINIRLKKPENDMSVLKQLDFCLVFFFYNTLENVSKEDIISLWERNVLDISPLRPFLLFWLCCDFLMLKKYWKTVLLCYAELSVLQTLIVARYSNNWLILFHLAVLQEIISWNYYTPIWNFLLPKL